MTSPLDKLASKQRAERLAARQAPPPPALKAKPAARPITARPVGFDVGKLAQYQAALETAMGAIKATTAMTPERLKVKRAWLAEFMPFVDSYRESGDVYPNDVAVECMVWLWDVGDIEQAATLALYLIGTGNQHMPERFDRRDLETFVCDAVYEWAAKNWKDGVSSSPYLEQVMAAMDGASPWELNAIVRGKLYAIRAKNEALAENWPAVVEWCDKATAANPAAGVKGLRDSVAKKAMKATD